MKSDDRHTPQVNLWSMLEVNTAILCASVPALKPLFTWKKVQEFRHPNKFSGRSDDPLDSDSQHNNKNGGFHRKPSDASLYPHLETVNLTQLSSTRSPLVSPSWKQEESESRPPSSKLERDEDYASASQRQVALHVI